MAVSRRALLGLGASMLLPRMASGAHTDPKGAANRAIFGYGRTGLGTQLGEEILGLLPDFYPQRTWKLEHMPGENSIHAMRYMRQAPRDGSTILLAQSPQMTAFSSLYRQLPYSPERDFIPLAITGEYALFMALGPVVDPAVKTLDDYLRWVEKNPSFNNIGFAQFGSPGNMAQLILSREKGVALQPQVYRGTSMIIDDLLEGYLAAAFLIGGNGARLLRNGILRPIAVTSPFRVPGWDVPTCREQGVPQINLTGWYGWFLPAGTPDNIVKPLQAAMQNMIVSYDFLEILRVNSLKPIYDSPGAISARIKIEQARYAALMEEYRVQRI
ncbi:Bug family tripartite tricarboxylate transporter substrate binding protein [Mangrovibacter yixingensis]|uniref:Bug family tripartite tricarboxylate transporter substrate binding protein n=1 Tax=Mangrovibacter yixingensis TaxID=1529639 RepID=UPI001CFAB2CB|nr:tripartite tricarboxylate transporter substrate binding protein [Mangrovibacter yixingensis]